MRCLGQINPATNPRGRGELVGLDLKATERCVRAAAATLDGMAAACRRQRYLTHNRIAMHSAYLSGRCWLAKRARYRAGLAARVASMRPDVTVAMRDAVARAELERLDCPQSERRAEMFRRMR
jgi:hypothetical protein